MYEIKKFIALVGLPRSGTTLCTAILDAHHNIEMFFEPFYTSKNNPLSLFKSPAEFKERIREQRGLPLRNVNTIGVKETSQNIESLQWLFENISQFKSLSTVYTLFIVRNPIHTYLSAIDGAKKYWGNANAKVSEEGISDSLRLAVRSTRYIINEGKHHNLTMFSYEALVEEPQNIVKKIMDKIGIEFEDSQLEYYKHGAQPQKVMGDPEVAKNPKSVNKSPHRKRIKEANEFINNIDENILLTPANKWLFDFVDYINDQKIIDYNSFCNDFDYNPR